SSGSRTHTRSRTVPPACRWRPAAPWPRLPRRPAAAVGAAAAAPHGCSWSEPHRPLSVCAASTLRPFALVGLRPGRVRLAGHHRRSHSCPTHRAVSVMPLLSSGTLATRLLGGHTPPWREDPDPVGIWYVPRPVTGSLHRAMFADA